MTPGLLAQSGRPFFRWDWVVDHADDFWARTVEHLELTGLSVSLGFAVALVLAIAARRWRFSYGFLTGFTGVLYTIPSLAAFGLLAPLFGLSTATAVVPLASYTLLILLRNTVAGLDAVPDEVREAADGLGYRPVRRFLEVELPLALPVIIAGLRIATVTVVGLVTVTSLFGRGGLGFFILNGISGRSVFFPTEIVAGTVLVVVLALLLDAMWFLLERLLTPWARR